MKLVLLRIRGLLITISHLAIISTSLTVAVWIRFDFSLGILESPVLFAALMIVVPIKMFAFHRGGLHRSWWRYAGLTDLARIGVVNVVASGISAIALFICFGSAFPRSVYVIDFLVCFLLTAVRSGVSVRPARHPVEPPASHHAARQGRHPVR